MKAIYRLYTHDGYYDLAADGSILYDSSRNYSRSATDTRLHEWRIIGISKRAHSHSLISLVDAAKGVNLGQGWVHDMDHGTHRMWGSPSTHRARQVEVL